MVNSTRPMALMKYIILCMDWTETVYRGLSTYSEVLLSIMQMICSGLSPQVEIQLQHWGSLKRIEKHLGWDKFIFQARSFDPSERLIQMSLVKFENNLLVCSSYVFFHYQGKKSVKMKSKKINSKNGCSGADALPICCGEKKELSPKAKFLFYH